MKLVAAILLYAPLWADTAADLAGVTTIYVDALGGGENSGLIRDKIVNRLIKSGRFQVSNDPAKSDATLTGSVAESQMFGFSNGSGGTRYDATAAVRLISRDQAVLWVSETKNGRFSRSASSSVADHIVKGLLKAALPSKKK